MKKMYLCERLRLVMRYACKFCTQATCMAAWLHAVQEIWGLYGPRNGRIKQTGILRQYTHTNTPLERSHAFYIKTHVGLQNNTLTIITNYNY